MKVSLKSNSTWLRKHAKFLGGLTLTLALGAPAYAEAGGGSPWENAVNVLQTAFTGPIAKGLALVAIVIGGLTFAFGEGAGKKTFAGIVFGLGMAVLAVKFMALSRQAKCIPIVATQSISSLKTTLPGETWRTLLQAFRTKISSSAPMSTDEEPRWHDLAATGQTTRVVQPAQNGAKQLLDLVAVAPSPQACQRKI